MQTRCSRAPGRRGDPLQPKMPFRAVAEFRRPPHNLPMRSHLFHLLQYDDWGNREALRSIAATAPAPPRLLELLGHIISAETLWLERLRTVPQSFPVWPQWTVTECEQHLRSLAGQWTAFVGPLSDDELLLPVSYRNTKGEPWTSSRQDIILHVVMHSAYHRGQIAAAVREAGGQPASTDYIHAVRSGAVR